MKTRFINTALFIFCVGVAYGQDATVAPKDTSYWKKTSEFGLNFNQGSFNTNWTGGGVASVAFGAIFNAKGDYNRDKINWVNDFQFQYGTLWNKSQDEWRKSADRLFFDSKVGKKLKSPHWQLYANLNVLSQVAAGYAYSKNAQKQEISSKISNIFAPLYITEAAGFEYKPVSHFSLQLAPIALRQTIISDKNLYKTFPKNYGVEQGKTVLNDVGVFQIVANYDKDVAKDVNFKWRYQIFAAYRDIKAIDNRLDVQLNAKVAKYFNVNLGFIALYDQDQVMKLQTAQTMGIGFLYKW